MLTIENLNNQLNELNADELEIIVDLIEEAIEAEFAEGFQL